jgi:uncharacterized protein (DUF433 family)
VTSRVINWPRKRMVEAIPTRIDSDPREVAIYSVADAAIYLGIPASTLRSWIRGREYPSHTGPRFFRPLIEPADPVRGRLSFANLAEAHILQATRDKSIALLDVRAAIDTIQRASGSVHPLIADHFYHFGKELFIKQIEQTINVSRGGQLGLRPLIDECLERLERDGTGYPIRIFPMRTKSLVLDVHVASGQPVVKETRILASMLYGRKVAGETPEELAQDYQLSVEDVKEAIRLFEAA